MAKVLLGFFSFTEITDPSEHRSYNEWHQLDHMPEQYPLPGVVFGQRWVSTPACRRARAHADADAGPGALHDPVPDGRAARRHAARSSTRWASTCGPWVGSTSTDGRACRAPCRSPGNGRRHACSCRPRPFPTGPTAGSTSWCVTATCRSRPAHEGQEGRFVTAMVEHDGVAGVWSFGTDSRFDRHPWRPGHKTVTVCYLDAEPLHGGPGAERTGARRRRRLEPRRVGQAPWRRSHRGAGIGSTSDV